MRKTTLLAAAASLVSLGLIAPAAVAATPSDTGRSLTGTATCDEGQARLVTSVDRAGIERGRVTVTGLGNQRWRGGLQLNPGAALAAADKEHLGAVLRGPQDLYLAKHGRISASAKLRDSRSLDASASFMSPAMNVCSVSVMTRGDQYAVTGVDGGLVVQAGRLHAVRLMASGEAHHRYQVTLTVRTRSGVQKRSLVRVAGTVGMLAVTVDDLKGLAGLSQATATVKDLTVAVRPESFSLTR